MCVCEQCVCVCVCVLTHTHTYILSVCIQQAVSTRTQPMNPLIFCFPTHTVFRLSAFGPCYLSLLLSNLSSSSPTSLIFLQPLYPSLLFSNLFQLAPDTEQIPSHPLQSLSRPRAHPTPPPPSFPALRHAYLNIRAKRAQTPIYKRTMGFNTLSTDNTTTFHATPHTTPPPPP